MSNNINVWYKRKNENKYHKIKEYINRTNNEPILSWTKDISNKLEEFDVKLWNPKDSDMILFIPQFGDTFAFTDSQNNILNNTFFGVNMSSEWIPQGLKDNNSSCNYEFNLRIKTKNFSTKEIILDYSTSFYINDILPIIFADTPSLGGIKTNGIVIPKHDYGGENFLIAPLKFQGEQFDALTKILDVIGWTFSYYYYSELDAINGLHVIKQISMYPKTVYRNPPNDWVEGFSFNIWKNGFIQNIDYPSLDDRQLLLTEKSFNIVENGFFSKNAIKLKLFIKTITGEGTRKVITASGVTDTYNIGGCFEIKSIAIRVVTNVLTVTSTIVFAIPVIKSSAINFYQQRLIDNNLGTKLRCRIISNSTEYFSDFTINDLTQTITLLTAIPSLSINDEFELTNSYDILKANLASYPPEVNGYIIKKLDQENTTIQFTLYDKPEAQKEIVVYYYPITQVYKSQVNTQDIEQTGYRGLTETIKETVTIEQADEIFNEYLKLMKPLVELNLNTSHRKNILDINTLIPINFETIQQSYIVTESKGKILSEYGLYKNNPLITQDLKISSYRIMIDDILAKIRNDSEAILNLNLASNILEYSNNKMKFKQISNATLPSVNTPIITLIDNITATSFDIHFLAVNTDTYIFYARNNSGGLEIGYQKTIIAIEGTPIIQTLSYAIAGYPSGVPPYPLDAIPYALNVSMLAIRGIESSSLSNIVNVNYYVNQFPTSITGSWGTLSLNYSYVFNPQSSGDLTNYGSSGGTAPYLDRRNSGDNYPTWVNDSGVWGLDFHNSNYSGIRVPLDNFPSSDQKITIICFLI